MFGNILNNGQIKRLVEEKAITIRPFDVDRLRLAHYALRPAGILWSGSINEKGKREYTPGMILIVNIPILLTRESMLL